MPGGLAIFGLCRLLPLSGRLHNAPHKVRVWNSLPKRHAAPPADERTTHLKACLSTPCTHSLTSLHKTETRSKSVLGLLFGVYTAV